MDDQIAEIIDKHKGRRGELISILESIQSKFGYLPKDALIELAEKTGRSLVDIYGVATFYKSFSLKPRGRHLVSACLGTACHVRGGATIANEIEKILNIKAGETTHDREFTLETVNCLGACALGPVIVVDGHYFPKVSLSEITGILDKAVIGLDRVEIDTDKRIFPVEVSCARCNHSLMDPEYLMDGHPTIRVTVSFSGKHGWLILSSLYGSYNVSSKHEIPSDTIVNIFCPHCHAEMIGGAKCTECGAPMVAMIVRSGGVVQICTRRGCQGHLLDLGDATID
jgi:NADH-quinone oxidoreductase subunit E